MFFLEIAAAIILVTAFFNYKPKLKQEIKQLKFRKDIVYLVLRGTNTKIGGIVKDFNLYSSKASHIGIGILEGNKLNIFHVNENLSNREDNLFYESIEEFASDENVTYLSIWQVVDTDSVIYQIIFFNLKQSLKYKYDFDKNILINNNKYYCSEYVINMIDSPDYLKFESNHKMLNGFAKAYLKRDTLVYYPVDGFVRNKNVRKIFEWEK